MQSERQKLVRVHNLQCYLEVGFIKIVKWQSCIFNYSFIWQLVDFRNFQIVHVCLTPQHLISTLLRSYDISVFLTVVYWIVIFSSDSCKLLSKRDAPQTSLCIGSKCLRDEKIESYYIEKKWYMETIVEYSLVKHSLSVDSQ